MLLRVVLSAVECWRLGEVSLEEAVTCNFRRSETEPLAKSRLHKQDLIIQSSRSCSVPLLIPKA